MALLWRILGQGLSRRKGAIAPETDTSTIVSTSFATETARPVTPQGSSVSSSPARRFSSSSSDPSLSSDDDAGGTENAESLVIQILGRRYPLGYLEDLLETRGDEIHLTEAMVRAARKHKTHGAKAMQVLLKHTCNQQQTALTTGAKGVPRRVRRALLAGSRLFGPDTGGLIVLYFWGQVTIPESGLREIVRSVSSRAQDVLEVLLGKRRVACAPFHDSLQPSVRPATIHITEAWLAAAASNRVCGTELLSLLLDELEADDRYYVPVTTHVLEIAAQNEAQAETIFELLSRKRSSELQLTLGILTAAAANSEWGANTQELLLTVNANQGRQIRITSDMIFRLDEHKFKPNSMAQILKTIIEYSPEAVHFTLAALDALAALPSSAVFKDILSDGAVSGRFVFPPSMVETAAANPKAGVGIMEWLLRERGHEVQITERVVLAAIKNEGSGLSLMELLFRERASEICITERLLEAAAKMRGRQYSGEGDMKLKTLLGHASPDGFRVTTRMAENALVTHGEETVHMLLKATERHDIRITDNMIAEASKNCLEALLERSQGLRTSDGDGRDGMFSSIELTNDHPDKILLLLTKLGEDEAIREAILVAALESKSYHEELMALVLAQPWKTVTLTKRVVLAHADRMCGRYAEQCEGLLERLLQKYGDEIRFGRGAVEAVMEHCTVDTVRPLLQIQGPGRVRITPEMVVSAAGNPTWGQPIEILELLIQERKMELQLTEKVLDAAMRANCNFLHCLLVGILNPGERVPCLERVVFFAAGESQYPLWDWLLQDSNQEIQVTEAVLERIAGNESSGHSMLRELCREYDYEVHITERVLEAAAKNPRQGFAILRWLFDEQADNICITERVVETAAANTGRNATDILELLLKERPDEADVTERVLEAAASNAATGDQVIDYLLREYGDELDVSERVLEAAAGNREKGEEILSKVFARFDRPFLITENVLVAAVRNGSNGSILERFLEMPGAQIQMSPTVLEAVRSDGMIKELLKHCEHPVWLTESVLETYTKVARREATLGGPFSERVVALVARYWPEYMTDLLVERGGEITITPAILETCAAGNNVLDTASTIAYLLRTTGRDKVPISKHLGEVAAANAASRIGLGVLIQLLDELGDGFTVSEGMMRAAVGNTEAGTEITDFLLQHGGSSGGIRITERVMEIAAGNGGCGEDLIDMLLQHSRDSFRLTESIAQAAAANEECGGAILELFRTRVGSGIRARQERKDERH
ncbi:hypothetical protein B0I37DRAFT_351938 [Chaetomium sp. MPI-CAGE-AT-0009]|nr:hypothetical protein B0I37DRAFT_351938 [Chaetomium sp. MPI-CAGE-AT-0009]